MLNEGPGTSGSGRLPDVVNPVHGGARRSANPLARVDTTELDKRYGFTRTGIPVREGIQSVYKSVRDSAIMEGAFFIAMFVLLISSVQLLNDSSTAFHNANALVSRFITQEIPGPTLVLWQKTLAQVRAHCLLCAD